MRPEIVDCTTIVKKSSWTWLFTPFEVGATLAILDSGAVPLMVPQQQAYRQVQLSTGHSWEECIIFFRKIQKAIGPFKASKHGWLATSLAETWC